MLTPHLPDLGLVTHGGLLAVAHDGLHENVLVFQELLHARVGRDVLEQRQQVLVLGFGVDERLDATGALGHARELALAHALFLEVDELVLDAALLEPALGLLRVEALLGAKNLNVHASLPAFEVVCATCGFVSNSLWDAAFLPTFLARGAGLSCWSSREGR